MRYGKRSWCECRNWSALMDAIAEIIVLLALLLGSIGKGKK